MEDGLWPDFKKGKMDKAEYVLILVLMEDGLWLRYN